MIDCKKLENRNKSAQRFISDTAASIAPPVHTHIPTTYNKTAWPEGRSARRENGLRNYECFPSSHFFEKRKNFRLSDEVNRGVLLSVCRIIVGFLDEI